MKKYLRVDIIVAVAVILFALGFMAHIFKHDHSGFAFSRSYCPNCYEPTAIRIDVQKVCENCGYKFYLYYYVEKC